MVIQNQYTTIVLQIYNFIKYYICPVYYDYLQEREVSGVHHVARPSPISWCHPHSTSMTHVFETLDCDLRNYRRR